MKNVKNTLYLTVGGTLMSVSNLFAGCSNDDKGIKVDLSKKGCLVSFFKDVINDDKAAEVMSTIVAKTVCKWNDESGTSITLSNVYDLDNDKELKFSLVCVKGGSEAVIYKGQTLEADKVESGKLAFNFSFAKGTFKGGTRAQNKNVTINIVKGTKSGNTGATSTGGAS